jgi:hypothetical protein
MDTILIGIAVLLVVIVAFVYLKLSRQMNSEISKLNKKIESISTKNNEQTKSPPLSTSTNNVVDTQQPIIFPTNTESSSKYNNIKEQYDTYVQNNNFDNIYEEDLSENIRNEIDQFTNNELSEEIPTGETEENVNEQFDAAADDVELVGAEELAADDVELAAADVELVGADVELAAADDVELAAADDVELAAADVELVDDVELSADDVELAAADDVELADSDDVELAAADDVELADSEDDSNKIVEINDLENTVQYKNYSIEEINNLTVKELQDIARKNKLKVRGKKDELIARVKTLYNLNIIMN